jgi:hypothetical protein
MLYCISLFPHLARLSYVMEMLRILRTTDLYVQGESKCQDAHPLRAPVSQPRRATSKSEP